MAETLRGQGAAAAVDERANVSRKLVGGRSSAFRAALAAVGAWLITVAPLISNGSVPLVTKVVALLAIVPGVAGPLGTLRSARMGRHVGISVFVAACGASWVLASLSGALSTLDGYRAVLGAAAWGLFALAWWHPWRLPEAELASVVIGTSRGLAPRRRLPRGAALVALAGALGALGVWALAWRVEDRDRAVLAQTLAVAASVALLTVAARIAVLMGREPRDGERGKLPISRAVVHSVLLMVLLAGLAWFVRQAG